MGYYISNKKLEFLQKNPINSSISFVEENLHQILTSWDFLNFQLSEEDQNKIFFSSSEIKDMKEQLATNLYVLSIHRILNIADITNEIFGISTTEKLVRNQLQTMEAFLNHYHDIFYEGKELEYSIFDLFNKDPIVLWNSSGIELKLTLLDCFLQISSQSYLNQCFKNILSIDIDLCEVMKEQEVGQQFIKKFFNHCKDDFKRIKKLKKE